MAVLLIAAFASAACDETASIATAPAGGAGGGGAAGMSNLGGFINLGGGGGWSAGAGGLHRGMSDLHACDFGALPAPLLRYSKVELQWTLEDVFGLEGKPLPFDWEDRLDAGLSRQASLPFLSALYEVAQERAALVAIDEARLAPCEDTAVDRSSCLDGFISQYGQALYRRPLSPEQLAGYVAQFQANASESPLGAARKVLVSNAAVALFRVPRRAWLTPAPDTHRPTTQVRSR